MIGYSSAAIDVEKRITTAAAMDVKTLIEREKKYLLLPDNNHN